MPGFDGTGPIGTGPRGTGSRGTGSRGISFRGFWGQKRGLGSRGNPPRRRKNRLWNCFNFLRRTLDNPLSDNLENQKSFLEEKLKTVEEEKRILTEKIEELKRN